MDSKSYEDMTFGEYAEFVLFSLDIMNQHMKIYLCRHGQTTGDIEDRYGGDYDDHLTELGMQQAVILTENLSDKGIEKVYVSPKIRAIETAEMIVNNFHVEMEVVTDLRERNQYGILTGMVKSEAKEKYPELIEMLKDYRNTIEGAESNVNFETRVLNIIYQIAKGQQKTIAIITHGGPIKTVLRQIEYHQDFKIEDCGFVELIVEDQKIQVLQQNGIEPRD